MNTVTHRLALWPLDEEEHLRTYLRALISYRSADPYCVRLTFLSAHDEQTVEWQFSRELLACGLITHVGVGDVRIEPALRGADMELGVTFTLVSDGYDDRFALWTPSAPLWRFLRDTYALVPIGAEPRLLDIDAAIHRLLVDPGEVTS
ncbi:SsgA family sporulation/cell division regulator [Sphaerisporangium sp. NPDC005288]|uniref:SsgA family sporulation/cell division regulator n=1 Tax=Sphaerisporangium sp. NPDC005288 TaxID=3155114 RepID=UPI0033BC897F